MGVPVSEPACDGVQTAPGLFIAGLLLSAKAGFMIYAVWHAPQRYYENKFWYPLGVLTELLVRRCSPLPIYLCFAITQFKRVTTVKGLPHHTLLSCRALL